MLIKAAKQIIRVVFAIGVQSVFCDLVHLSDKFVFDYVYFDISLYIYT